MQGFLFVIFPNTDVLPRIKKQLIKFKAFITLFLMNSIEVKFSFFCWKKVMHVYLLLSSILFSLCKVLRLGWAWGRGPTVALS